MSTQLFKNIPSRVGDLVRDVRTGRIGLPDLQRPFVWPDSKIRELYDSMIKGYPIGYIMLWESPLEYTEKKSSIGNNEKTYDEPKELVIDGQQRLTALVASMYGIVVKDKNFKEREIKISSAFAFAIFLFSPFISAGSITFSRAENSWKR